MQNSIVSVLILALSLPAFCHSVLASHRPLLVPQPKDVSLDENSPGCKLGRTIQVFLAAKEPQLKQHFKALSEFALPSIQFEFLAVEDQENAQIRVEIEPRFDAEEYRLKIAEDRVEISASTIKGVAHATATLTQLIGAHRIKLPALAIHDAPSCNYRSFMIDLGRNLHSLECLKETVDLLWYYKLDSLHLHLTDDQRFAFPSKAFPNLPTEEGAISWEEFAELERYARIRGITLIPELEVPGHSALLCRTYPEVFGKNSTDVARLPSSRAAIKVLLGEMIELFPSSPYIHVGGDEAFGVPEDLQRDLINELHDYLKQRGKKTIVWEGPRLGLGENKVDEDVIHMNWRTMNFPADEMLKAGYPVVNAAWDPLYIVDHYPRNNFTMASPAHIYKTLDLFRFKHFNPGIRTFASPIKVEPTDQILGFCMPWWEGREENFFPLITPRVIPMAEVAWSNPKSRDFADFDRRAATCERIRRRAFYPVAIKASPIVLEQEGVFHGKTTFTLSSQAEGEIRYTLDGSEPTKDSALFKGPFTLDRSAIVRAASFLNGAKLGHGSRRTLTRVFPQENLALGKPVTTSATSGSPFSVERLTDGGTGNLDYYLGYPAEPEPIDLTIDLGKAMPINRVVTHAFFNQSNFESYQILVSQDGEQFTPVANRLQKPEHLSASAEHDFPETEARYVRISTHGCKGNVFDSFSRLTEIQVFLDPVQN